MSSDTYADMEVESGKNLLWWLYLMHGASFLFSLGALSFIPLIVNYIKRADAGSNFIRSHHSWQIRSFWWYLVWMASGAMAFLTLVGIPLAFVIWAAAWVWKAYRLIRGFLDLRNTMPMPA
jgi:uncharacterized membrane protein